MKLLFIRHGATAGNLEKRYIGRTDEPLCSQGIDELKRMEYPVFDVLVSSPMRRCVQTAQILFPAQVYHICEAFRECDFGDFEGRNYIELNGNPAYQAWINSGGSMPFPNGESPADFRRRCCDGFQKMTDAYSEMKSMTFIIHGGAIMAILSHFVIPQRDYYDWMTANAHGWLCDFNGQSLTVLEKL